MEEILKLILAEKSREDSIKEFYGRINITLLKYYLKGYSDIVIDKIFTQIQKEYYRVI